MLQSSFFPKLSVEKIIRNLRKHKNKQMKIQWSSNSNLIILYILADTGTCRNFKLGVLTLDIPPSCMSSMKSHHKD